VTRNACDILPNGHCCGVNHGKVLSVRLAACSIPAWDIPVIGESPERSNK